MKRTIYFFGLIRFCKHKKHNTLFDSLYIVGVQNTPAFHEIIIQATEHSTDLSQQDIVKQKLCFSLILGDISVVVHAENAWFRIVG